MIQLNKVDDLNGRFASLGTDMTQSDKFENLNERFVSLGTDLVGLLT